MRRVKPARAANERKPAGRQAKNNMYILNLFVTGRTLRSVTTIDSMKSFCNEYLPGRCRLKIIDLYKEPLSAVRNQIIATPALVKEKPLPKRMLIGNLTDMSRVFAGLDLRPQ